MTPHDLRLAWRAPLAEPGYTAIGIVGLGIGTARQHACCCRAMYATHGSTTPASPMSTGCTY
ncbi:hypothetical protein [Pseudoduganella plicata]|uniref:Uncharacterized protein n=1 Tax=Pseudoduganella plicata TaxID=321984 RepID=A0ABX5S4Q5_9BURK|nr:hypothetical protein [Pseudoduganella plicata]QBQ35311.1 hypothetical protein E1742_03370 [Pseudoduganella plicata]